MVYRYFPTNKTVNKRSKKLEFSFRGRKLSARSVDHVEASKVSVGRNPKKSLQKWSSNLSTSRSSLQNILTFTLSSDFALNFLPLNEFLISCSVYYRFCRFENYDTTEIFFSKISVEIKLSA